ncbi:hypothetical protein D3C80_1816830 [compost metagenome]
MGLQQHLGNSRSGGKVAVNLKRRMSVEQIRVYAALCSPLARRFIFPDKGEQIGNEPLRPVAVLEAGPQADFPAQAPARSAVSPDLQRRSGCPEQLGS